MPIEDRGDAAVITHAVAADILSQLRDVGTERADFRSGLGTLGRICGDEIIDEEMETTPVSIETPLTETTGERIRGRENVVIVTVLRAAMPFVDGLLTAFPDAKQGVVSASRDEETGMNDDGTFPISVDYINLPDITADDIVIVADPMLATGSTMVAVLEHVLADAPAPATLFALSVVSAPAGLRRVQSAVPAARLLTVSIDDHVDEDGYIVPGLGDAGDRAFGTT